MLLSEEFEFRFDLGIAVQADNIGLEGKQSIIDAMAKHFSIHSVKAELDQILCGLASTLGALDLLRNNPTAMRPLLVNSPLQHLTADYMFDTCEVKYSPSGSNSKQKEEAVVMMWLNFLQRVESKHA